MKQLYTILTAALLLLPGITTAQCIPSATDTLHVNKVSALIHNGGDMFWNLVGSPGYIVPYTSNTADQRHSAFASAIWLGGLDNSGQLHVAAQTYRQSGIDYYAGPYRSTHQYECGGGNAFPTLVFDAMRLSTGDVLMLAPGAIYIYDPGTQTSTQHVLPVPKQVYNAIEMSNGKVLFFGDQISNLNTPDQTVIMDVSTYSLSTHISLNYAYRSDESDAAELANGKILLTGLAGSEVYDPVTATSTPTGPATSCKNCALIALGNGQALSIGGQFQTMSSSIYDPGTNNWTAGPNLQSAYFRTEAIELDNGKILVAGSPGTVNIMDLTSWTSDTLEGLRTESELSLYKMNTGEILFFDDYHTQFYYPDSNWTGTLPYGQSAGITSYIGGKRYLMENGSIYNSLTRKYEGLETDRLFRINKATMQQYQNNPTVSGCLLGVYKEQDECYTASVMADYPWQGNVSAGEEANMAPWNDHYNDQQYDPTNMDTPELPGDEALWWVFHDDGPHTETGGAPLGVQIKSIAYAWSSDQTPQLDTMLDYVTFYHYEIKNLSGQDYHDVMAGIWLDVDLGNYSDDYVGCDTLRQMGFAYNADPNDETSVGYGLNPPALGIKVLCGPKGTDMSGFMYYENDFSLRGNPEVAADYYAYLNSTWKDGSHLVDNGLNGYPGTAPGPQTNYMYPGDPGWCGGSGSGGWSEVSAGNTPFDRRMLVNVGPFDLAAGETVTLNYAVVWARGFYNDNLGSVCELQKAADAAQDWFDQEMSLYCQTGHTAVNDPVEGEFGIYPNPTNGEFTIRLDHKILRSAEVELFDLTGRKVFSQTVPRDNDRFDIHPDGLSRGMYVVRISNLDEGYTGRIVIR